MKTIEGLTDEPRQNSTIVLDDGTSVTLLLEFRPQQKAWFYSFTWNGQPISGQQLVASPNILRRYLNLLPFGIAVLTKDYVEPNTSRTFVDGTTSLFLLQGSDLTDIETQIYDQPPVAEAPTQTVNGVEITIPPSSWGPAYGDLAKQFPNPWVIAIHDSTASRLTFGEIPDGMILKRVGGQIIGVPGGGGGGGDVVGPAGAINNHVALFDGTTGKLLKDGGALPVIPASLPPSGAAGGQLGDTYPNPTVRGIRTTSGGGTQLTIGAIADGQYARRIGTTLVGDNPAGTGDVSGPASSSVDYLAAFADGTGKLLKQGPNLGNGSANLTIATALGSIAKFDLFQFPPEEAYPISGLCTIALDANNRAVVRIGGDITFAFAGISKNVAFELVLKNNTAGTVNVTWPGITVERGSSLPATLTAGQWAVLRLQGTGTTAASLIANMVPPPPSGGTGTVTSVTPGRGMLPGPFTTAGSVNAMLYVYNVQYFGAKGDNATDDWDAIQNGAIAAGVASGKPFCLYFPGLEAGGKYRCSKKLELYLNYGQALTIDGDGRGVSQILFTNTGTDCGIFVSRAASGGTYLSDVPFTMRDISVMSNSTASGTRGLWLHSTGTDAGTQGAIIENCGFFRLYDGAYWDFAIDLDGWVQVWISKCFMGGETASVFIHGTNGATSVFWIKDCMMQGGFYGIFADGRGGGDNRIEGIYSVDNTFIAQAFAVWAENSNTGGDLEVCGGAINCRQGGGAGVHVAGFAGITVMNIPSLNNGNGTQTGPFWNGVEILGSCWAAMIQANCIALIPSGGGVAGLGVYILGGPAAGSIQGTGNVTLGNSFYGFGPYGNVKYEANVSRSICALNTSDGGAYIDNGSANNFSGNI